MGYSGARTVYKNLKTNLCGNLYMYGQKLPILRRQSLWMAPKFIYFQELFSPHAIGIQYCHSIVKSTVFVTFLLIEIKYSKED